MSVKRKKKDLGDDGLADGDDSPRPSDVFGSSRDAGGSAARGAETQDGRSAAEAGSSGSGAWNPADGNLEPSLGREGEGADQAGGTSAPSATVVELERQLAEVRDQLLRKAADFDNYRKRMVRDKEESVRFANSALIMDLIDAIDGLERAISSTESSQDFAALHQGVVLIERQLIDGLERKWGLQRMACTGKPFDPSCHQAVTMGEPAQGDDQIVLEEYQSGYLLHERVVRPAKVKISAPRGSRAGASAAEGRADSQSSVDFAEGGRASGGRDEQGSGDQGK